MDSAVSQTPTNLISAGVKRYVHASAAFLMLGGGSLILMIVLGLLTVPPLIMNDNVRALLQQAGGITMALAILLSYPHFIWSFRFAYQQGPKFITKHSWKLVVLPLIILALLTVCLKSWSYPVDQCPAVLWLDRSISGTGIMLNWSHYNGMGQLLLGTLLTLYVITSGHHFSMQAFGVALACGEDKGYRLTAQQKQILLTNLYALWAVNLFSSYRFLSFLNSRSFAYTPVEYPELLSPVANIVFVSSFLALIFWVVVPKFKEQRRWPPLLAALPIVSIWLWLQPMFQPYGYQAWVVPVAHGAQYLWFSLRVENNNFSGRLDQTDHRWASSNTVYLICVGAACVLLGYLTFQYFPLMLDRTLIGPRLGINFFMIAGFIFISVHHYIVDSVVWKHDSRVRKMLSKASG